MKKRIDLVWRLGVVALLLVLAVAPAVLLGGSIAALEPGDPPDTYLDPIPAYINARFADDTPWITGTSIAAPYRAVSDVWVQVINNSDGYRWDAGTTSWVNDVNLWNPATVDVVSWGQNQYDWEYDTNLPLSGDLYRGVSYTVKVRAEDDDGYLDLTPAQDTFTYDDRNPDVSFTTVFKPIMYQDSLNSIKGAAHDDHSGIAQVRMWIERGSGEFWNGYMWATSPAAFWIPVKTSGTGKDVTWSIDQNSVPPLPQWDNNEAYDIWIAAQDKAGNTAAWPALLMPPFLYRHKLTSAGVYMDPLPQYAGPFTYFIANGVITGTARTEHPLLQNIVDVRLKIYDETHSVYWDDGATAWTGSDPPWVNCVPFSSLVQFALDNHWDWQVTVPGGITWQNGHTYKVMVQVTDDNTPTAHTYTSDWQSFTYDPIPPGSNIDPFAEKVYNRWTYLTGQSSDIGSKIDAVLVLIERQRVTVPAGYQYWDGNIWNNCELGSVDLACVDNWWTYLLATPQDGKFNSDDEDWMINLDTTPGLPPLRNGEDYTIFALPVDAAGNLGMPSVKWFTFRYDMASAHPTPVPDYYVPPTGTPGPTATPVTTETPEPTAQPTAQPTAKPTKTPAQPTPTVTPKPTSVTKTIGAAGGEICLDGKVCVDFPSGAFSSNTQVTVTQTTCSGAPDGFSAGSTCFTITPSGALGAAADVCVEYSSYEYNSLAGGDADRVRLAYKDAGTWHVLDTTIDTSAGTACAQTTHLSSWVLAIEDEDEGGGWQWWYWLLIGLAVLLIIVIIVLLLLRSKGGGSEGEEAGEDEGYEEEEL